MTQIVGPGRWGGHPRKSAFLSQIQCSLYCVGGRFPLRDICVFVVCACVCVCTVLESCFWDLKLIFFRVLSAGWLLSAIKRQFSIKLNSDKKRRFTLVDFTLLTYSTECWMLSRILLDALRCYNWRSNCLGKFAVSKNNKFFSVCSMGATWSDGHDWILSVERAYFFNL